MAVKGVVLAVLALLLFQSSNYLITAIVLAALAALSFVLATVVPLLSEKPDGSSSRRTSGS